ncbi:MAG TPA: hypothetical protein DCL15_17835 [Chloroflexi bacterium]|nr:hypothetical protein [Chloroflexota bacterium]HHW87244.1 PAS domain S-box protein [Chloroflexota bacterium]
MSEQSARRTQLERQIAEALQGAPRGMDAVDGWTVEALVHELSAYHEELEFQNQELRYAQAEIEAVKERYADLFHCAPYGYVVLDDDRRIQLVNATLAAMLGVTPESMIGQPITRYIAPDSQDALYLHLRRVGEDGSSHATELLWVGAGKRFPARVQSQLDHQSGALFLRMAVIDISEARAAQAALQASESRYRLLIEMADDIVLVFSLTPDLTLDRLVEVNHAACQQLGYASDELQRLLLARLANDSDLLPPSARQQLRTVHHALFETTLTTTMGEHLPVEIHASRFIWEQQPMVLYIARDLTERKRLEAQQREMEQRLQEIQKWESLGALAGGVAHDFNNLLAVISNNLELTRLHLGTAATNHRYIDQALAAVRRGAELTQQMLTYTGQASWGRKKIDINAIVAEVAALVRPTLPDSAQLRLELQPGLPLALADALQIQQLLISLLTNAIEAIDAQTGEIVVATFYRLFDQEMLRRTRLDEIPAPGRYLCIQVRDNGVGMDAATLQRLFDPFFTTHFVGRGLGMSAVLGIVRGHHGAIFVDSTLGKGTDVCVVLPPAQVEEDGDKTQGAVAFSDSRMSASGHHATPYAGTVLVVDDEDILRETSRDVLTQFGYRVLDAARGEEAIHLVETHGDIIDCVLLDLSMPGLSGRETCQRLLQIKSDLKIIIVSGYDVEDSMDGFPPGAIAGYCQKPYNLKALHAELQRVIQHR